MACFASTYFTCFFFLYGIKKKRQLAAQLISPQVQHGLLLLVLTVLDFFFTSWRRCSSPRFSGMTRWHFLYWLY
jgi:hypothetical protein